jgi:hypothetical protein
LYNGSEEKANRAEVRWPMLETFEKKAAFEKRLAEVIVGWPLYRTLKVTGDVLVTVDSYGQRAVPGIELPLEIDRYCETCKQIQRWQLKQPHDQGGFPKTSSEITFIRFDCKNCESGSLLVFLRVRVDEETIVHIVKVGQYPALELNPSPILASAMTRNDLALYRHALTCRNSNFGIGAVAYLRRIVENQINYLLDLIADAAKASDPDSPLLERLSEMKGEKRFSEKIDYAAEMLPKTIRRGGHNPIATLHDLTSEGLHNKSDEECVDIFDRCKLAFEYVIERLKEDHDKDALYQEAMKALARKKAR